MKMPELSLDAAHKLSRLREIIRKVTPADILYHFYQDTACQQPTPDGNTASALGELDIEIALLSGALPTTHPEFLKVSEELRLSDIEEMVLFTVGLRSLTGDPAWFHFSVARALNRLLVAGLSCARAPCFIHALLTLRHTGHGQHIEPLPRSIIARELLNICPRDAIAEGVALLQLGDTTPMRIIDSALHALNLNDDQKGDRPTLSYLRNLNRRLSLKIDIEEDPPVVTSSKSGSCVLTQAIPEEIRYLRRPNGDSSHYIFRMAATDIPLPPIVVCHIRGGTVSVDVSRTGLTEFYVYDASGNLLEEYSRGVRPFIERQLVHLTGPVAVIGNQYSGTMNLSHFLLDNLPMIYLYRQHRPEPTKFLLFDSYGYYEEILKLVGLAGLFYIPQSRRFSASSDSILVSSSIVHERHPGYLGATWSLGFLNQLFSAVASDAGAPNKIFISRADARVRRIVNDSEVRRLVANYGYRTVVPGELSPLEQIQIFRSSTHIIGSHGAGLTNILFSPASARVLEIFPPYYGTPAYWILATRRGQRYHAMIADDPELARPDYRLWTHRPTYGDRDLVVQPAKLADAIDLLQAE